MLCSVLSCLVLFCPMLSSAVFSLSDDVPKTASFFVPLYSLYNSEIKAGVVPRLAVCLSKVVCSLAVSLFVCSDVHLVL